MEFNFKLSQGDAQKVLNALAKEPYVSVVEVINVIQKQANDQVKEKEIAAIKEAEERRAWESARDQKEKENKDDSTTKP
jgi:hypothetical protein